MMDHKAGMVFVRQTSNRSAQKPAVQRAWPRGRGCGRLGVAAEMVSASKAEIGGHASDKAILLLFHFASRPGSFVIVAEQMEYAMDNVANKLALPGRSEMARLRYGHRHANENISPRSSRTPIRAIIES